MLLGIFLAVQILDDTVGGVDSQSLGRPGAGGIGGIKHVAPVSYTHLREGNTRTVVMMMTFFVEYHGYFMDQELMAASAGYVRDSFVRCV